MYFFPPMMSNIVMIKMPKPKPVVRCTKLAPMLSRKMAITTLPIIYYSFNGICLLYADIGNRMAVDSLFWHCHIFLPFTPCFQMVDNRSLNPTRPLL